MMIPGAFPPHAQCDQGALPPHLTASGSGVWSWAWVTTRPLQRVSSDCPKKKMPVGGLSMQNCECVCVWLTKLSFPGGRGGQWRWWPQWCFCSVLAGLHFTLYHCCWTMVTHTHSPNILLLSYLWSSESMRVVSHPGVWVVFYFRSDTCWGQFLQSLHDLNIIMFFF